MNNKQDDYDLEKLPNDLKYFTDDIYIIRIYCLILALVNLVLLGAIVYISHHLNI